MKLYDVEGRDRPLMLSDEHAKILGATEHRVVADRPGSRALVADWRDYAIGQGADPLVVEQMTRAELVEQYGGEQ